MVKLVPPKGEIQNLKIKRDTSDIFFLLQNVLLMSCQIKAPQAAREAAWCPPRRLVSECWSHLLAPEDLASSVLGLAFPHLHM